MQILFIHIYPSSRGVVSFEVQLTVSLNRFEVCEELRDFLHFTTVMLKQINKNKHPVPKMTYLPIVIAKIGTSTSSKNFFAFTLSNSKFFKTFKKLKIKIYLI
jgi:hypothetical protein